MVIFLSIVLVIVSIFGIVIISNLLNQISTLEAEVLKSNKVVDDAEAMYTFFLKLFTSTLAEMEHIDKLGAFKADDEVGFVFNTLLESIKQVKFKLQNIKDQPDDGDDGVKG